MRGGDKHRKTFARCVNILRRGISRFFFFNDPPTPEISPLPLPAALPISLNRVRFTSPVPVGSRLRARLTLQAAEPIEPGGLQMTWLVTVEREGADKPACVAESVADRKSTRLNSSHLVISYAVFCLKKKTL